VQDLHHTVTVSRDSLHTLRVPARRRRGMALLVPPQLVEPVERLVAPGFAAAEPPLGLVDALVLGQVGRLAERLAADGAFEGLVARVDAAVHSWTRALVWGW